MVCRHSFFLQFLGSFTLTHFQHICLPVRTLKAMSNFHFELTCPTFSLLLFAKFWILSFYSVLPHFNTDWNFVSFLHNDFIKRKAGSYQLFLSHLMLGKKTMLNSKMVFSPVAFLSFLSFLLLLLLLFLSFFFLVFHMLFFDHAPLNPSCCLEDGIRTPHCSVSDWNVYSFHGGLSFNKRQL